MKATSGITATPGRSPSSAGADGPLLTGFAPVYRADARVLILGSLPGAQSLAQGRYYGNPRNQFWLLVGAAIGVDLAGMDYPARLGCLLDHGIALWDVVATGQRRGSLDTALRVQERADLAGLVAQLPQLRLLAFNGATAARQAAATPHPSDRIVLPSSSPAHTMALARKQAEGSVISHYLGEG